MQEALTEKSAECCKEAGQPELCLHHICYLITESVTETATSNTETIKKITINIQGECAGAGTLAIWKVQSWEQLRASV